MEMLELTNLTERKDSSDKPAIPSGVGPRIKYKTGLPSHSTFGFCEVFIDENTGYFYKDANSLDVVGFVHKCPDGGMLFHYYV